MAQSIGNNQPNSYRLISVVISNNEGNQIDVSNLVDSFSITESIYQMFLTGSITIVDNMNIFNRLNITEAIFFLSSTNNNSNLFELYAEHII